MTHLEAFDGLDHEVRLDASGGKPSYLVIGSNGTHVRLSASAYNLIQAARSGLSWEALAEAMSRQGGRPVNAEDLEASYDRVAARLNKINGRPPKTELPSGFWLRLRVLPRAWVGRVAASLGGLFTAWPAAILLSFCFITLVSAMGQAPAMHFEGVVFWPAYLLFTASLIAHELGHVSACRRFGARPNDIGFTVYWIFPAFYSDVTTAWQLRRRHRVIVDLGGVYFQLLVGCIYWLAFLATGWAAFQTAFLMILYGCLFSLNPIFKFDGYWMLADTLGVTHLSRQPKRLFSHLADRLRGRPVEPLPWPRWVIGVLTLYAPLSIGFWVYFTWRLAPNVWRRMLDYPPQLVSILRDLSTFHAPDWSVVQTVVVSTFLILVSGLMLRHLATRLVQALQSAEGQEASRKI
ncbi:MAG: hypothetical protein AAF657_26685 [Acidobacteriota bacterium]